MKIIQQWVEDESLYIRQQLIEYNRKQVSEQDNAPYGNISFVVKNEQGMILGGITGKYSWQRMHVDILWVDDSLRGQGYGSQLLKKMEDYAIEMGCTLIFLDTYSFQAPDFYKKLGFRVFGTIENHPDGTCQYFLKKELPNSNQKS